MSELKNYILRLGDNALILSHRLAEYSSRGPFLEEDLAISNIALDHLGQAELLLKYAADLDGMGRSEDDLAYRRPECEYTNALLVEQPNTDFAYIMARQYFIDVFNYYMYSALKDSSDERLAAIASKAIKEVTYHLRRSREWVVRLGKGTEESNNRIQQAVDDLWRLTGELFETEASDKKLMEALVVPSLIGIKTLWDKHVVSTLKAANIVLPSNDFMMTGGRKGVHSEYLGHLLSEMQYLQRAYPDATW